MRSQRGVTLTSLVTYIIVILIVVGILATIMANFESNVDKLNKEGTSSTEIDKFNIYFIKEVKKQGNEIDSISSREVLFTTGNKYTYKSNSIYLNDNIKISEDIEKCVFESNIENGKTIISVTIKAKNSEQKQIEYVLSNEEIISNYEDERSYTTESSSGIYVKNGLVLWLDGIFKGDTEGKWIDQIYGTEFTMSGDYTFEDKSVHFTNAMADRNSSINPKTLEIVLKNEKDGYGVVFLNDNANQSIVFNKSSEYIQMGGENAKSFSSLKDTIITYTICFDQNNTVLKCYKNGQLQAESGSTEKWSGTISGVRIGKYYYDRYPFQGNIYCIRAYNRELNEDEIQSNYAMDRQRFGF